MIKAVVKTTMTEIPANCGVCPFKRNERMMNGDRYYFCMFNPCLYVEPYICKKNPECPLVKEDDNGERKTV